MSSLNADHIYLFDLAYTGRDSKKIWTTRTAELVGIDFKRHRKNLEALLKIDINDEPFNFQKSLNIDAINNEIKCIERKAHLSWENSTSDAKINDLMATYSNSGNASAKLVMTGDSKDSC